MNKKDFEELLALYNEMNRRRSLDGWLETFFGNRVIDFGETKVKASDFIKELAKCDSYEDVEQYYKDYDQANPIGFEKLVNDIKTIAKTEGIGEEETRRSPDEIDKSFFKSMHDEMEEARKHTSWNSGEFNKMEKSLEDVMNYCDNESFNKDEYLKKLDDLEKLTDKYLAHKVEKGVKANAAGKVKAAMAIKEYIAEKKAEYFRLDVMKVSDTERVKLGESSVPEYMDKYAEILGTQQSILAMAKDKLGMKEEELKTLNRRMTKVFTEGLGLLDRNGISAGGFSADAGIASILLADIVRNELLACGGKVTPLLKEFIASPTKAYKDCANNLAYYRDMREQNGLEKYLKNDIKKNIADMYRKELVSGLSYLPKPSLADNAGMIDKANEVLSSIRENDALTDVTNPLELARANSLLAKYAKANIPAATDKIKEYQDNAKKLFNTPKAKMINEKIKADIKKDFVLVDGDEVKAAMELPNAEVRFVDGLPSYKNCETKLNAGIKGTSVYIQVADAAPADSVMALYIARRVLKNELEALKGQEYTKATEAKLDSIKERVDDKGNEAFADKIMNSDNFIKLMVKYANGSMDDAKLDQFAKDYISGKEIALSYDESVAVQAKRRGMVVEKALAEGKVKPETLAAFISENRILNKMKEIKDKNLSPEEMVKEADGLIKGSKNKDNIAKVMASEEFKDAYEKAVEGVKNADELENIYSRYIADKSKHLEAQNAEKNIEASKEAQHQMEQPKIAQPQLGGRKLN